MTPRPMIKMMALLVILVGGMWPTLRSRLPVASWRLGEVSSPAQAAAHSQPAVRTLGRALTVPSAAAARISTLPQIGHPGSRVDAHLASAGARFPAPLSAPTPPGLAESLYRIGATAPELPLLVQAARRAAFKRRTGEPFDAGSEPPVWTLCWFWRVVADPHCRVGGHVALRLA